MASLVLVDSILPEVDLNKYQVGLVLPHLCLVVQLVVQPLVVQMVVVLTAQVEVVVVGLSDQKEVDRRETATPRDLVLLLLLPRDLMVVHYDHQE